MVVHLVASSEQPEAVYVVVTGLIGVYQPSADGQEVLLERFGIGDVIGDTSFITGRNPGRQARGLCGTASFCGYRTGHPGCGGALSGRSVAICSGAIHDFNASSPRASALSGCGFLSFPADPAINTQLISQNIAQTLETFGTVTILSL